MTSVQATEQSPPIRVQKTATHADNMTDWVRAKSKITVSVAPRKKMTKSKQKIKIDISLIYYFMDQQISTRINTIFLEARLQLSLLGSDSEFFVFRNIFHIQNSKLVIAIFGKLSNPVTNESKQNIGTNLAQNLSMFEMFFFSENN